MADPNLGMMLSTTLKKYRKTLVDNIHYSNAVFFQLKDMGNIKEEDGGERIVQPLLYATNSTAGSYDGYDTLDVTPQTGIDAAEFNWKQYSASIVISGKQLRQNKGRKEKVIDLLEAKTKQAETSLIQEMVTGLFSDGTGNSSKDLTGLRAMVLDSGTYGGIASATYTWWASTVESTAATLTLAYMRTGFYTPSLGGKDTPNLVVTTQTLFETYEGLLTANIRMDAAGTKKLADGGFQTLQYKGQPVVFDEQCPTGYMYLLNTKHMKLVVHEDANFDTTEFVKPENQDAMIAQILFMGNLTCDRRKSHYVLTGKTS